MELHEEQDFLMDLLMVMEVHEENLELQIGDYGEYELDLRQYVEQRLNQIKRCPVLKLVPKGNKDVKG